MQPKIVTFYTPDYADHVEALLDSARNVGLSACATEFPPFASWFAAVIYKPRFIYEQLQNVTDEGVLWVDADARFFDRPDFSILDDIDIAAAKFRWSPLHQWERLTGTMFFRKSDAVMAFLEDWIASTEKWSKANRDVPEQLSLKETWELPIHSHLRKLDLPLDWVYIEPEFQTLYPGLARTIVHLQASRTMRK